ncbi:acyl carrier protein [Bradyrhizobium jicamae]|uniref:Acyl carrier protein n=1 Tax=Bradyrhizobium jicamae TaxID=280332 RepID=A0ABS5FVR5_9BRAD|nr:acyl carrier protein [Bradyrhizobium jicamae]MBR0800944.1 acyl carrier protein [Bradyrhizobium jicamae]
MSIRLKITSEMQQIAHELNIKLPPLKDDLPLQNTGLDSLGFALLIARLEDELGRDPFTNPDEFVFPDTIGDFVRAYENVQA